MSVAFQLFSECQDHVNAYQDFDSRFDHDEEKKIALFIRANHSLCKRAQAQYRSQSEKPTKDMSERKRLYFFSSPNENVFERKNLKSP